MVKNKVGGNKAKKFARKNMGENMQNRKLRFSQDEDEVYGIVNKIVGNGQAIVFCQDGIQRLCFIRNKFSGRNKQNNLINTGSWVIIGKRSWETPKENKLEKCDLLEIYTNNEKHILQQECNVNFTNLLKEEYKLSNIDDTTEDDNIVFSRKENENIDMISIEDESQELTDKNKIIVDGINFDDI